MPFCEKCGAMNPDESTVCRSCGKALNADRRTGNTLIIIIAVIMVVATILVLFFLS
jgi:predicted nucleic acid-binding Zn ribbon protein